ncbi:MAG: antitoxin [Candidatus Omnitrophica bacterium]|nr:antitoxin [Candidatus Omnitrophota bacterium]
MKRRIKLTRMEREIEEAAMRGEYVDSGPERFKEIAEAIQARRKDAVLNIRVNSGDLENLKEKAGKLGVKYQTFISELLHRAAQA